MTITTKDLHERLNIVAGDHQDNDDTKIVVNNRNMSTAAMCEVIEEALSAIDVHDDLDLTSLAEVIGDFDTAGGEFAGELTFWFDK